MRLISWLTLVSATEIIEPNENQTNFSLMRHLLNGNSTVYPKSVNETLGYPSNNRDRKDFLDQFMMAPLGDGNIIIQIDVLGRL